MRPGILSVCGVCLVCTDLSCGIVSNVRYLVISAHGAVDSAQ